MSEPTDKGESDQNMASQPKRKKVKRVWWQRKRYILLVIFVGFYGWPIVNPFSPQDRCEFGTGSLDLHQQMKKEVRAYLWKNGRVWMGAGHVLGSLPDDAKNFSQEIGSQIFDFSLQRSTATERTAAFHTLLRAYQMKFRQNWPSKFQLEAGETSITQEYLYQSLNYALSPFCIICHLLRHADFGVGSKKTKSGDSIIDSSNVYIRLPWDGFWSQYTQDRLGLHCPEVLW